MILMSGGRGWHESQKLMFISYLYREHYFVVGERVDYNIAKSMIMKS